MDTDRNLALIAAALREFGDARIGAYASEAAADMGIEALLLAERAERRRFENVPGARDWGAAIVVTLAFVVIATAFLRFA